MCEAGGVPGGDTGSQPCDAAGYGALQRPVVGTGVAAFPARRPALCGMDGATPARDGMTVEDILSDVKGMLLGPLVMLGLICAVPARGQVALSEVMFDPSGSEFADEFIEVHNLSDRAVDLAGWRVGDEAETDEIVPRGGGLLLPGGAFGLILDADYF